MNNTIQPIHTEELSKKEKKRAYHKAWCEANKDKIEAKQKAYRESNKDKIKAYLKANKDKRKAYRESNKDKMKAYRESNKDKIAAQRKSYYITNNDKLKVKRKTQLKAYREANKDKLKSYQKAYYEANRAHIYAYLTNRRKEDAMYKLKCTLRSHSSRAFKRIGQSKPTKTQHLLGCSWEEAKTRIESLFTEGMSWDNYGKWHIDHIIPIASATTLEEAKALNHISNLQPLWAFDNFSKGSKLQHEHYIDFPNYG
jgi:hypothetical protein